MNDLVNQCRRKDNLIVTTFESPIRIERKLMLPGEIVETQAGKIVAVGRVGESVRGGKMWYGDTNQCTTPRYPMNFFHRADNVIEMFNDVVGIAFVELIVGKRPRPDV